MQNISNDEFNEVKSINRRIIDIEEVLTIYIEELQELGIVFDLDMQRNFILIFSRAYLGEDDYIFIDYNGSFYKLETIEELFELLGNTDK